MTILRTHLRSYNESALVTYVRGGGRSYRERIRALGMFVFAPQVCLIQRLLHEGFSSVLH